MVVIEGNLEKDLIKGFPENKYIHFKQDGFLKEICDGFRNAIEKHNTSAVLIFDGRSGMGKTTLCNQTGLSLDPDFGLHKIHFNPETFLEGEIDEDGKTVKVGLANAKEGDYISFDEAMIISNRSAMSSINRMIIQAMSMIRSKRIYVAFCVNSIFDLDRNLVLHRADCLFHVYGESLTSRGSFCAFFRGKDGVDRLKGLYLNGKKFYDYSKPKANFIASFSDEFIIDDDLYNKDKDRGVNAFLQSMTGKGRQKPLDKEKACYNLHERGYSTADIAEILCIGERTAQRYLEILRKRSETPSR